MKVPIPKDKILTDTQIRKAICRFLIKNKKLPTTIIINYQLVSEILGIYLVPDNGLKDMTWRIYGMDIVKEHAEKWFRLE